MGGGGYSPPARFPPGYATAHIRKMAQNDLQFASRIFLRGGRLIELQTKLKFFCSKKCIPAGKVVSMYMKRITEGLGAKPPADRQILSFFEKNSHFTHLGDILHVFLSQFKEPNCLDLEAIYTMQLLSLFNYLKSKTSLKACIVALISFTFMSRNIKNGRQPHATLKNFRASSRTVMPTKIKRFAVFCRCPGLRALCHS